MDEQLKTDHNVIHPINRAYLIDDIFALAATKTVSYATAFSLIEYLSKEEHYVPWSSALRSLAYIGRMFSHTAHHNRYKVSKIVLFYFIVYNNSYHLFCHRLLYCQ